MAEIKKQSKGKIVLNVLSYVGVFVFFFLALVCAIAKFQGAKFSLFGNRYDVVLTNSMSRKNDAHKDFLEGHDDQFQAFDLAVSKPVTSQEELKVYDIVIYTDKYVGTNMHRIVNIEETGKDTVSFLTSELNSIGEYKGYSLYKSYSEIKVSTISFKHLEFSVFSTSKDADHFNFNTLMVNYTPVITTKEVDDGYIHNYVVDKETSAPGELYITHKFEYDTTNELVLSLKIEATSGTINIDNKSLIVSGTDMVNDFNKSYRYEIRGDAAKNSDGYYSFKEIQSKVVSKVPKMGYLVRYLNSIWGGVMFLLLGFSIIVFQIISDRMDKKKKLSVCNTHTEVVESQTSTKIDSKKEETNDKVDKPVKEVSKPKKAKKETSSSSMKKEAKK